MTATQDLDERRSRILSNTSEFWDTGSADLKVRPSTIARAWGSTVVGAWGFSGKSE